MAVTVVEPAATGVSRVDAVFVPPAMVIGELLMVPAAVLLLCTVTDTVLSAASSWLSAKKPPESAPVSTRMDAAPNPTGEVKEAAPMPPGEVILNPAGAKDTDPLIEVKPGASML